MQSNTELERLVAICEFADTRPRHYRRGVEHPECTNRTKSPPLIVPLQQQSLLSSRHNRIVRAAPRSADGYPDGRQHEEYAPSSGSCPKLSCCYNRARIAVMP